MPARQPRTTKLDLRLPPEAKERLNQAANEHRQSLSQFVLESALGRANETLASRQRFGLNAEQWGEFIAALDAPQREMPRLDRLMAEPSVFEPQKPK